MNRLCLKPISKNIILNTLIKSPFNNNNNNYPASISSNLFINNNNKYFTTSTAALNENINNNNNINNKIDNNKILTDKFNRHHTYLRISLIDTCNLKCLYCHPEEGYVKQQEQNKLLTSDEIIRLSKLFASAGVNKIRFTGGEPLVRREFDKIIEEVGKIKGIEKIGITTNGILLNRKLENMYKNGVNLFNISLDTLDRNKFMLITKRLGWERVMQSIDNTLKLDNVKVKINCVVMKDLNDMEIIDFVEMTKEKPVEIRFIEFMPFNSNKWSDKKFVSYQDMIKKIKEKYPTFEKHVEEESNNTSKTYHVPGFKGKIGFITSMSEHFCSSCNRLRITADGNIKVCLFDNAEVSLRDKMRNGATDEELLQIINACVLKKKASHAVLLALFINIIAYYEKGFNYLNKSIKKRINNIKYGIGNLDLLQQQRYYSTSTTNNSNNNKFTHIDNENKMPTMVDVSDKVITKRTAHARSLIEFPQHVLKELLNIENGSDSAGEIMSKKGPVFATAIISGTLGVKQTSNLIPFCHPLPIESIKINIKVLDSFTVQVDCIVSVHHKTGVEMEALTGASVASLCIYDMCKALSKDIIIKETKLISKTGGKSDLNQQ